VREVRALTSKSSWNLTTAARTANVLLRASDRSERLLLGLQAAVGLTSASAGLIYCFDNSGPVIRYVHGGRTLGLLGERPSRCDPALNAACRGGMLLGSVEDGEAERSIWLRLVPGFRSLRGVAMVPLIHRARLFGAIELGRCEHEFRAEDALELARLATVLAEQYADY
jgi:GAF domain-containing protein